MAGIDDLSKSILKELQRYSRIIEEDLEVTKKEVADDLLQEVKSKSPKSTGSYAKGWRIKKSGSGYLLYNKTDYQLTHLLEHGHAKRGGGRVQGKQHIAPAEEKAIKDLLSRIEKMIKK